MLNTVYRLTGPRKIEAQFSDINLLDNKIIEETKIACSRILSIPLNKTFDIIIGNPPYVESKKISEKIKYGNLYAEIIENSIKLLNNNGKLGFIIPISFVSTPRMKKIRNFVLKNSSEIILLNYSDRPSSLFFKVHQKLSILFMQKNNYNQRKSPLRKP
mgnify:CR=1 FL=1